MNNTFGTLFTVTTFGESHGAALGATIDGMPAGVEIDPDFIRQELDRRRPGQSCVTTPRKEGDAVEILSGVFEGRSTGTPLTLLIRNADQHSADYTQIASTFRPGHADITFDKKFGFRDYRGGGRSSGRETVARVAAGAVAKLLLKHSGISVRACTVQIGNISATETDWDAVEQNPVRSADANAAVKMAELIQKTAKEGDSVGGKILCEIRGVPPGLGEPVFDKFDALLAHAMLSIGGIKGFEIGDGFVVCSTTGSRNNDPILPDGFGSNHAGGVLGGISNGADIVFRVAVKPTPSIYQPQRTIDRSGAPVDLLITGRHDPCLVPRIVPVVEAMAAIVTADLLLRARCSKI